jgi:dolichol-phosphate mannosyltransferase
MAMLGAMPKLSILVPVFNEERTIVSVMQTLGNVLPDAEIIYIDDGSRDRSLELLKSHARPPDKVLTKPNGGKGSAIRMGLPEATGIFCAIQDADLEYDPREILTLLAHAEAHPGVIIFGSRFLKPNSNIYPLYLLGNKVLTGILNVLFRGHLSDSYTCYKLFPTDILKKLPLTALGFELEAELSAYSLKMGYTIEEVPINYHPRTFEEGKKINWKDAVKGVWTMLKARLR